jgi:hypothetical protein
MNPLISIAQLDRPRSGPKPVAQGVSPGWAGLVAREPPKGAKVRDLYCTPFVIAVAIVVGGCALNRSPLNTEMASSEMRSEVQKHFRSGTSEADVVRTCEDMHMSWFKNDDQEIVASIRPHGFYMTAFYAPAGWGSLDFCFDSSRSLENVWYYPPQVPTDQVRTNDSYRMLGGVTR